MSFDADNVVLVVEDEPLILDLLTEHLQDKGYRVLRASNSEQAFEILATKPHLDLMITDYRLPGGVSGVKIAEPALQVRPDLKVIFISGYTAEIIDTGSSVIHKAPILAKPFTMETLHSQIEELLK